MSRGLATALETAVNADYVEPLFFIQAEFDSETIRAHTGLGTITWGGDDYLGVGSLARIGAIEEISESVPVGVVITLSGIDSTLLNIAMSEDYMQRPITIYFGCLDPDDKQLVTDPVEVFGGKMVNMDLSMADPDLGDAINLVCESDLQILDRSANMRFTASQLQSEYPGDLGLEYQEQMQDARPIWRGREGALSLRGAHYQPLYPGAPNNPYTVGL